MAKVLTLYDSNGASTLVQGSFPLTRAGQGSAAKKFGVKNTGTVPLVDLTASLAVVGTSDGLAMMRHGLDTQTLSPPWALLASLGATGAGGVFPALGQYQYTVTALNPNGETMGADAVTVTLAATTQRVTLSWARVPLATGYKVYRTPTPGVYPAASLLVTLAPGTVLTYIDAGGLPATGEPPVANTTAGPSPAYGTPPTLVTTPRLLGTLAIGQWAFLWAAIQAPPGVTAAGNRRRARWVFRDAS